MGIFAVFRLANDYAKAKKLLLSKKIDKEKIKKLVASMKEFIDLLYEYKDQLADLIKQVKDVVAKLKLKEKEE